MSHAYRMRPAADAKSSSRNNNNSSGNLRPQLSVDFLVPCASVYAIQLYRYFVLPGSNVILLVTFVAVCANISDIIQHGDGEKDKCVSASLSRKMLRILTSLLPLHIGKTSVPFFDPNIKCPKKYRKKRVFHEGQDSLCMAFSISVLTRIRDSSLGSVSGHRRLRLRPALELYSQSIELVHSTKLPSTHLIVPGKKWIEYKGWPLLNKLRGHSFLFVTIRTLFCFLVAAEIN